MKEPVDRTMPHDKRSGTMMARALALCERMSAASIEFRLVVRLPKLVEEFGEAHRALREPAQVRALLEIDPELIDHARPVLHRVILAAVDEAARTFVQGLDREGWREALLMALEVDDPPSSNVVHLDAWRRRTPADEGNGEYDDTAL